MVCIVFLLSFILNVLRLDAENVNGSFIEEVTVKSCLLIVHEINGAANKLNGSHALSEQLVKIFREDAVKIVLLSTNEVDNNIVSSLILYPRRTIDRTCLLSPDVPPTSIPYVGPLTVNGIVQFVNEKCNTFRLPSGGMTFPGLLRKNIMDNLFRLQKTVSRCSRVSGTLTESEFFWEYLTRSQPVVIEGGAKNWMAISKWTPEYLREKYYNKQVHIKLTEQGEFEGVELAYSWPGYTPDRIPEVVRKKLPFPDLVVVRPATAEMKFSEFIDLISVGLNMSGISAYLEYSSIPSYMPELEEDIEEPFGSLLERRHLNMWLSDGNTLGKLHFDPFDNFLCQVSFILFNFNCYNFVFQ